MRLAHRQPREPHFRYEPRSARPRSALNLWMHSCRLHAKDVAFRRHLSGNVVEGRVGCSRRTRPPWSDGHGKNLASASRRSADSNAPSFHRFIRAVRRPFDNHWTARFWRIPNFGVIPASNGCRRERGYKQTRNRMLRRQILSSLRVSRTLREWPGARHFRTRDTPRRGIRNFVLEQVHTKFRYPALKAFCKGIELLLPIGMPARKRGTVLRYVFRTPTDAGGIEGRRNRVVRTDNVEVTF